jgi:subtilase family serine protease
VSEPFPDLIYAGHGCPEREWDSKRKGTVFLIPIKNQGAAWAIGSLTRLTIVGYGSAAGRTPRIAPGQTVVVKVFIPAPPIEGDFAYEVIVNADGSVLESNYTNNVVRESCAG